MSMTRSPVSFLSPRLRFATLLLAGGGVLIGNTGNAQVLVRTMAYAIAVQGSQTPSSSATNNNGVVTTSIGTGGSASATPSGTGITRGEALAFQPGGSGSLTFQAGTTTRADLATARQSAAILNTPVDVFLTPQGISESRLEDILYFVNATAADLDLAVSWTVDGIITPPSAPYAPVYWYEASMRLVNVGGGTTTPRLRGSPYTHNQMELWKYNYTDRIYRDSNSGSVFTPGAGAIWNITPIGDNGARMEGTLVIPPGLSSIRVANSLNMRCSGGTSCDFSLTGAQMALGALPAGVTMASASGAFLGAPRPTPLPSGLTVESVVGNQVTVRWTPPSSAAATGYVLQGGIAPGQTLASVPTGSTATRFSFTAPTGIFYLRMVAQTAGGNSAPSNEVLAYVNVPAPPSPPAALLGLANGSQLGLSWRNTAGGGTPAAMRVEVSGAISATLPIPVGETFAFSGVPPGTYSFAVRAANSAGTSSPSAPVTLTFPGTCATPQPPANLQVTRGGNQLAVTWEPPANGAAVGSYVLNVSGPMSLAIPLATRSIGGAVPPGTYSFTVRAVNACGQGAVSAAQAVTVP